MESLGDRLRARRGVGPGFDVLRIALSLTIVGWHAFTVVYGFRLESAPLVWIVGFSSLGAFFALSGFLISASALRLSLGNFLINRGLRILPALALEIVLCALILGPAFTRLGLGDYLTQGETWRYFTNIVGLVNYRLPGVFETHPDATVNASIWTVPHELVCYLLISALILTGGLRRPGVVLAALAAFLATGVALNALGGGEAGGLIATLAEPFTGRAARLYAFFLAGIAAFLLRERIPYSRPLFAACLGAVLLAGLVRYDARHEAPFAILALVAPLTYITAFLGVSDLRLPGFLRHGDYSYGIYLYGWPIQQVVRAAFGAHVSVLAETATAIPLIFGFAMLSWHLVEKPILQWRRKFSFVARVRLEPAPAPAPLREAA